MMAPNAKPPAATPTVSVLMPAYNAERYLSAAIEGLLAQEYRDFELIVVDDGSTDATPELLAGFDDPRLIRLRQPVNRGYAPALNRTLEVARGRYLARQDADDLSLPGRLAAQVEALESDPGLVLCGTAYEVVDEDGTVVSICRPPRSDTAIRWQMLFHNAFAHSSVMLRRETLEEAGLRYDAAYVPSEDYLLWSELLRRGRGVNLAAPLVRYRRHPEQISERETDRQRGQAERVAAGNLARLGTERSGRELAVVRERLFGAGGPLTAEEAAVLARSAEILDAFAAAPGLDRTEVARVRRRWARQVLVSVPASRLGEAWRAGLLPAVLRTAPGTALAALARRLLRRLGRRRRADRRAPAAEERASPMIPKTRTTETTRRG